MKLAMTTALHSRAELKGQLPLPLTPNFSWVLRLAWRFNRLNGFALVCVIVRAWIAFLLAIMCSCERNPSSPADPPDPQLATKGSVEVTAKLVEIPDGAIFKRDLYDYATILKYQVLKVHRGQVKGDIIYVGHYNPWKPRRDAPDKRVKDIGGNLRQFQAGQVHHLALELPIEDFFMGGIVNKYFGKTSEPLYWAVWTDPVQD